MADETKVDHKLKFTSKDGKEFIISEEIGNFSTTWADAIKSCSSSSEEIIEVLSVNCNADIAEKFIEWCQMCLDADKDPLDPHTIKKEQEEYSMPKRDKDFLENMKFSDVHTLLLCADFLNSEVLIERICQHIADTCKTKTTVKELGEFLNITNDYTEEEAEALRNEHAWAEL